MKTLIAYATMSGNTQEVAEIVQETLQAHGQTVDMYRIGGFAPFPMVKNYDSLIIGTYTWDRGSTPEEVKDFVADVGFKPTNVFVFGTGDTQFGGDELYCKASDKLAKFYQTEYPVLKIEQSPRGVQTETVKEWAKGVLANGNIKTG